MIDFIQKLFTSDFMGHGYCYLWRPEIVWLHAISDAIITLSYYFIPVMLVYLVRKRADLPFHWMFFMFGLFILGCGTTHAMEIWTLWNGTYRLAGVIKAITAGASLATAVALVPMVPKALLLSSPSQLRAANLKLEQEIAVRRRTEEALEEQRNFVATVLNTVGTLIVVLDLDGRIVQCNRACVQISGREDDRVFAGRYVWDFIVGSEERERFQNLVKQMKKGHKPEAFECYWLREGGAPPLVSWSTTVLADAAGEPRNIIAAGMDVTESRRLEKAILDISAREEARIGQDLHDGLGQHLTGIAFMSKVLESNLSDRSLPEAKEAARIVERVNEAISKTRELSRGLLPVSSGGLIPALERWANEVASVFGIDCEFTCEYPVLIRDENLATHLYRIAQEAVNNAVKHARPAHIAIRVEKSGDGMTMSITDDGAGLPEDASARGGMGLRIMSYRARMIGAALDVSRNPEGGTTVLCQIQAASEQGLPGGANGNWSWTPA